MALSGPQTMTVKKKKSIDGWSVDGWVDLWFLVFSFE